MSVVPAKGRRLVDTDASLRSRGRELPGPARQEDDGASTRVMPLEQMLAEHARHQKQRPLPARSPVPPPMCSVGQNFAPRERRGHDDFETRVMPLALALASKPRAGWVPPSWSSLRASALAWAWGFPLPRLRQLGRRRGALLALALISPVLLARSLWVGSPSTAGEGADGAMPPAVELRGARAVSERRQSSPLPATPMPSVGRTAIARPLPASLAPPPLARSKSARPAASPGGRAPDKTLERRAIDALAAGDTQGALFLYQQLATEQPDHTAYREAHRILLSSQPSR